MTIEPVAYFHSPFKEKFGIPRQSGLVDDLHGQIVFEKAFRSADAVRGLDGFSHIWLLWGFSLNRAGSARGSLTVRPPRLGGNQSLGVFATRSPYRPNPIGLSCVKIDAIRMEGTDAPVIEVRGADLADGTPIYDIKPYISYADSIPDAASGFVGSNDWQMLKVIFPQEWKACFSPEDAAALEKILSLDPRPRYQDTPGRDYGLSFSGRDVHFTVCEDQLTVTQII